MKPSREEILSRYVPEQFVHYISGLLRKYPVRFRIVKPRKTKLGDFRFTIDKTNYEITVNGDLNPYSFLITTLHEFAHLIAYHEHGRKIQPHGKEWKQSFANLLTPVITDNSIPDDLRLALSKSVRNVKASSCTDIQLQRVLMRYDATKESLFLLENINKNTIFEFNGKHFIKGHLRRTRFVCTDTNNGRQYLINALARVKPITDEEQ